MIQAVSEVQTVFGIHRQPLTVPASLRQCHIVLNSPTKYRLVFKQSQEVSGSLKQSQVVPSSLRNSQAVSGSLRQSHVVSGSLRQSQAVPGSSRKSQASITIPIFA